VTTVAATAATYLTALEAALEARAGLAGVRVDMTAPRDGVVGDWIVLVSDAISEDREFVNNTRQRETTVVCRGFVEARDGTFIEAMARAGAIVDELEDEAVKHPIDVGRQTRVVNVQRVRWLPTPLEAGGYAVRGFFELAYAARIT